MLLALLLSCKDKSPGASLELCGVKDPINNLKWLKDMMDQARDKKEEKMITVVAVKLRGETIINYYALYMSCIGCIGYHCDGSRLDMSKYTQEEIQQYRKNIWEEKGDRIVLWSAE